MRRKNKERRTIRKMTSCCLFVMKTFLNVEVHNFLMYIIPLGYINITKYTDIDLSLLVITVTH